MRKTTKNKAQKTSVTKPKKEFVFHTVTPEELLPDKAEILRFTIPGRPATKKTHQQIVYIKGMARVLPSPQYTKYEKMCKSYCEDNWKNKGMSAMDFGVAIHLRVYLDTWSIGDHVGYLQAIGDILEKHQVIANDKFIHWCEDDIHWFGGVDKENPRCEIVIYRYRHPYEIYRQTKEEAELKKINKKNGYPTSKTE